MDDLIEIGSVIVEVRWFERVYRFVKIKRKHYDLDVLYDILIGLEGFNAILIDDDEISDLLGDLGVAFKTIRGSYSRSENFDRFYRQIEKLYYGG